MSDRRRPGNKAAYAALVDRAREDEVLAGLEPAVLEEAQKREAAKDMTMRAFEKRLLDEFQRDFPLTPRPYATIGERLGVDEAAVLDALARFRADGLIDRVGAVVRPNRVGASTLAAMAVPSGRLDAVADLVSAYAEVNHNYEREHRLNLWFVVVAADRARVDAVLAEIGERTGLAVLDLPMVEDYHLDLGFPLRWN